MTRRIACRGLIIHDEKILVVNLKQEYDYYCLPGWTLEDGEMLDDCIVRELYEELWVEARLWSLWYIHELSLSEEKHLLEFFYRIQNPEDFLRIDLANTSHGFEIYDLKRISLYDRSTKVLPVELMISLREGANSDDGVVRRIVN